MRIEEELAEVEKLRGKAKSKAVQKNILEYAIGMVILNLFFSAICVFMNTAIFCIGSSVIVFGILIVRECQDGRERALLKAIKKEPDREICYVICEELYFEEEKSSIVIFRGLIAAILMIGILVGGLAITSKYSNIMISDASVEFVRYDPEAEYVWEQDTIGYILVDFDAGTKEVDPTIPSNIDGIPVVAIGDRAFQNEKRVTAIRIPDSVTKIGSYAFKGCTSLQTVDMGDQVTEIGGEAFYDCTSLGSFTVPKSVAEIRGNTFQNCTGLQSVTLHDNITAIHAYAFQNCSGLTAVALPSDLTEIRANTFENCESLQEITIPEGVSRIAAHAFYGCSSLTTVMVPVSVKEIGSSAFRLCTDLEQISIPKECEVNERAFKESPTDVQYY